MPRRTVHVLLPTGSREEAQEAAKVLGGPDVELRIGLAGAHAAGQTLRGDVVVVGGHGKGVVERDATGTVTRFADMGALLASRRDARGEGAAVAPADAARAPGGAAAQQPREPEPRPAPQPPQPIPPQPDQPQPNGPPPAAKEALPDLEGMDRGQLISLAARRFPKAKPWATMPARNIRAALVELQNKR